MSKVQLRPYQQIIVAEFLEQENNIYFDAVTGMGINHILGKYLEINKHKKILLSFPLNLIMQQFIEDCGEQKNHIYYTTNQLISNQLYTVFKDYELIVHGHNTTANKYYEFINYFEDNKRIHINPNKFDLLLKKDNDYHLKLNTHDKIKRLERKHKIKTLLNNINNE